MRVLLDAEQVVEVSGIIGNAEENGEYTVFFEFENASEPNEGVQYTYNDMNLEEAKKRATKIIREALEKGFVDVSEEPWDLIED